MKKLIIALSVLVVVLFSYSCNRQREVKFSVRPSKEPEFTAKPPMLKTSKHGLDKLTTPVAITQVIPMEYTTGFLGTDQNLYVLPNAANGDGTFLAAIPLPNGELVAKVAGAFNHFLAVSTVGHLWLNGYYNESPTTWVQISTDSAGNTLNNVTNAWASEDTYVIEINNGTGGYEYGGNDGLGIFYPSSPGGVNMKPTPLTTNGRHFKKFGMNFYSMAAIQTHNDSVATWLPYNTRSIAPTMMATPNTVLDIAVWGANPYNNAVMCIVAQTSGDTTVGNLYAYGQGWGQWAGNAGYSSFSSIESFWSAGPWKSIQMSDNSTHALNYRGRIYGAGMQVQGEVGNGVEFVNRYTYGGYPGSIGWDFQGGENLAATPQPVDTAIGFAAIFKGTFFNFYTYAQDSAGNFYVWGRNKSLVQGDGQWTGFNNNSANPNLLDHSSPRKVNIWDSVTTTLNATLPTRGAAANSTTITTSTATLRNIGTPLTIVKNTGGTFICCSYTAFNWIQVSGPNTATINSPTSATTTVSGLVNGSYVFRVYTFDSNNGQDTAQAAFTVSLSGNTPPTVSAGSNQNITLPTSSVILAGSASANSPATSITTYAWTQTSGPNTGTFSSTSIAAPTFSGLVAGTYVLKLTVTDNLGSTNSANVTITVKALPTVNAGSNQTIQLPTSQVTLAGSASANSPATSIATYNWVEVSGPNTGTFSNSSLAGPVFSGLIAGTYTLKLTVTDNLGTTNSATMTVTVNPANVPPTVNAGSNQTITLSVTSANLAGTVVYNSGSTGVSATYTCIAHSAGTPAPTVVSGGTLTAPTASVTGMTVVGTYTFQLSAMDSHGLNSTSTMVVTVNPLIPPVCPCTVNTPVKILVQ